MTPKLTNNEFGDYLVGSKSHIFVYDVRQLEKTFRSTLYATLGIQGGALMLLLVRMIDPLGVGKLDTELLVGLFEV